MIFRNLDINGDWTLGNGIQNYAVEQAAISLDIDTALQVFLGECFFDIGAGVDWWNLIGSKDQVSILLQCRQVISSREGVTKINSVEAFLDRTTRRLSISYNIDTIYSRNSTSTVSVL
jgi:hypothetical protein